MAIENPFAVVGGELVSRIFGSVLYAGIAIILVGAVLISIYYVWIYRRRFNIMVKIISERSGEHNAVIFDKAAILYDRQTKSKYFRIWGLKRDLPVPNFNILQNTGKIDLLEIYRRGEDDFYFLKPARINKLVIVKADGRTYPIAEQEHKQLDADIAYWNVKRKQQNKKMFDVESIWLKILMFLPHIMTGIISIFVLYILLDHLPGILSELQNLVREIRVLKSPTGEVIQAWIPMLLH